MVPFSGSWEKMVRSIYGSTQDEPGPDKNLEEIVKHVLLGDSMYVLLLDNKNDGSRDELIIHNADDGSSIHGMRATA